MERVLLRTGTASSCSAPSLGEIEPHAGDWAARLGGNNNEESTLTQDIVLKGRAVTLTFYYDVESEDECGHDTGTVHVESLPNLAASGLPARTAQQDRRL